MMTSFDLEKRLRSLRDAFDQSFAVAQTNAAPEVDDLLVVRVGGDPYALRVRDTAGLAISRKIVPLPSNNPDLLGVAGSRGNLVPVYSLAILLGYRAGSAPTPWMALAGAPDPIGLAFEDFEGFARVAHADVHAAQGTDGPRAHASQIVHMDARARLIVDVASILERLKARAGARGAALFPRTASTQAASTQTVGSPTKER